MDDGQVTPPNWAADSLPAADTSAPADAAPTDTAAGATVPLEQVQEAFRNTLETRVAVWLQTTYGDEVLDEYLTAREKDDLAEMLMFEARQGLNIERIFREQEAALLAEMEQKMPGSTASLTGSNQTGE